MTFGNNGVVSIRKASLNDLDELKSLADQHREELGFILRPALEKAIFDQEIFVAEVERDVLGFVHYHHRKDQQTTLYHIVVNKDYRRRGIGQALVTALYEEANSLGKQIILLKCPMDLPANDFYQSIGFLFNQRVNGKNRPLNIWAIFLGD